jgi:hypothetical protein
MVFWVCIFTLPAIARSERPDLNSFPDADLKEMCELLKEWNTVWLVTMHGDDFARIHTTNDFLRWHRDHYIHLEHWLTHAKNKSKYVPFPKWNPANPVPNYFNGFDPVNPGTPYDNISDCGTVGVNGCRDREDYSVGGAFEFNQTGLFSTITNNIPLPGRYDKTTTCNFINITWNFAGGNSRNYDWNSIAEWSDENQVVYHNPGHVAFDQNITAPVAINQRSLMGSFGPNRAAAACIFWAWHAWIDDLWWNWDVCKKENNGTTITDAYDIATGMTITSGTTVTWDNFGDVKKIQGNLVIEENATLIIKNGQIVEMLDDYFTDQDCDIIVHKGSLGINGGKLIIEEGASIRGITSLGTNETARSFNVFGSQIQWDPNNPHLSTFTLDRSNNRIYPDQRAYYLCQWPGIKVYGEPTLGAQAIEHGRVVLDGTATEVLLDYAKVGVESIEGGVIQATNARFKNCDVAVDIHSYSGTVSKWQPLRHIFENCIFERTNQISRYFTNDNMYMHEFHDFRTMNFVKLNGVEGIHFSACIFQNTDPNFYDNTIDNNRGTGIYAVNSDVYLHKDGNSTEDELTNCPVYGGTTRCSFAGLSYGIKAVTENVPIGAWDGHIEAQEVDFTNCFISVDCDGQEDAKFYDCVFNYTVGTAAFNAATPTYPQRFVYCKNNLRAVVHGKIDDTDPMNVIYTSTLVTNSPAATLVEMDGGTTNYFNRVIANQLSNSNPSPESHGVLTRNDNSNSEITCNSFEGFTGAIYNLGSLKDHFVNPNFDPGNVFKDPPKGMEVHIKTDGTPTTAFRYTNFIGTSGHSLLDASPNVTFTSPSGTGETRCELTCRGEHVGVEELATVKDAKVYPNPNSGQFTVVLESSINLSDVTIQVVDQIGRVVDQMKATSYDQKVTIDQATGIYTVQVLEANRVISRAKIIIIK